MSLNRTTLSAQASPLADKMVFSQVKSKLGGNVRLVCSGRCVPGSLVYFVSKHPCICLATSCSVIEVKRLRRLLVCEHSASNDVGIISQPQAPVVHIPVTSWLLITAVASCLSLSMSSKHVPVSPMVSKGRVQGDNLCARDCPGCSPWLKEALQPCPLTNKVDLMLGCLCAPAAPRWRGTWRSS